MPHAHPWFARLYDPLMRPIEFLSMRRTRRELVAEAKGLVLEVGAGTGLNLPHYRCARRVVASEPNREMLRRAQIRAASALVPVTLVGADAECLPFGGSVFDTVVATCVFCSVDDPEAGFRELLRVLKPDGDLLLLEHVLSPSRGVARLQEAATPFWSRLAGGCRLNRPTLETAARAGFVLRGIEPHFGGIVVRARLGRDGTAR